MSNTKINIYHGNQIGGCITTISTKKASICIDFGENLPGSKNSEKIEIDGLTYGEPKYKAVFFTHYHGDHIGRMKDILPKIKLYMGETSRKVELTINKTVKNTEVCDILNDKKRVKTYSENKTIRIRDIAITPFSVDHSAYDAHMFLIETPDKVILHTGDLRMHGYRGDKLLNVIKAYVRQFNKRDVDILITEGTMMSRMNESRYTERDMLKDATEYMREHKYVFVICSSTNLDSLATFYQAGQNQIPKRKMYSNGYVFEQLKNFSATAGKKTSLYDFKNIEPIMFNHVSQMPDGTQITQEERMKKYGFVTILKGESKYEKWIDRFKDCDEQPVLLYSMWGGYIDENCDAYDEELDNFCKKYNAKPMHTSGHIYPEDLAKVIEAVNPKEAIIPIHTEDPEGFKNLNISDELKSKLKINVEEYQN